MLWFTRMSLSYILDDYNLASFIYNRLELKEMEREREKRERARAQEETREETSLTFFLSRSHIHNIYTLYDDGTMW